MSKKKVLIILGIIVGIGIIGLGIFKTVNSDTKAAKSVQVTEIKKEELSSNIITDGIIKAKEQRNIVSSLPYLIKEVLAEEGDKVSKGDILAKLDTEELEYNIKSAQINLELEREKLKNMMDEADAFKFEKQLENAELSLNNAKKNYENSKRLYNAGAISKTKLDQDKVSYERAKNEYELAKKELEDFLNKNDSIETQKKTIELTELSLKKQKDNLKKSIIRSPIDGTIVYSEAEVGIPANSANPLFIIDDTDRLEIEVSISEYDINDVKIGQKVKITGEAFKGREYEGKISYISPVATKSNTNTGVETNVKVKIDIVNPDKYLKPGFSVDVEVNTAHKGDALVVPYESLYQKRNGETVVFKVENGVVKEVPVKVGIEGDLKVEIISEKIKEGDKIIFNPDETIKDGMKVNIINQGGKK
ncbi:efflux RND transporter periplasmic adaptor subunit [Thermohalobacter berrensis]|uniref:Uncharacterized protein n=1 Tax=Thermohalobacter berrensis TaxID=99594 RepID=A0A419T4G4_9FIRM|nr:efflux RND transporter periplasmic adaptor subunit [Thermohalobacter berrensis]RKD32352.1 hypothetical protein BET03_03330 [Thermohalobacter berrensis]